MSKITTLLFFFLFAFGIVFTSVAQKQFSEGLITYKMSVIGEQTKDPMAKSMLENAQMVQYIKSDKSRVNMDMGMVNQSIIAYGDGKRANLLMDMMGQKYNVAMTEKDLNDKKTKMPKYTVQPSAETKQICGYNCKKAIVKYDNGETCIVYYTKDLAYKYKGFDNSHYEKIDGFPLEYEQSQENMKMKVTITKIEEKKVDDTIFNIPSGYIPMTIDEFSKMMSVSGMGGF